MKDFWDQRYSDHEMVYGYEPNGFFKSFLEHRTPGRLLLPAEGEGRNAVYAAAQGWIVEAFDYSTEAKRKAEAFAADKEVEIHYYNARMEEVDLDKATYDLIALIYAHLPSSIRRDVHHKLIDALKPGGHLIMEVFSKKQLQYQSGGPKNDDLLYSTELLAADFSDLKIIQNEAKIIKLEEGEHHKGEASVIQFVGQKPA
ncbi:MAG: class I SAM-dependent methyltransferase [Bacteroidota bacterium]